MTKNLVTIERIQFGSERSEALSFWDLTTPKKVETRKNSTFAFNFWNCYMARKHETFLRKRYQCYKPLQR